MVQSRKPVARRAAAEPSAARQASSKEPSLRFHHSAALRKKTLAVLERLEGAADPTEHRKALAEIVV